LLTDTQRCAQWHQRDISDFLLLEERVASLFVLLYQQLRQNLYFCTRQPGVPSTTRFLPFSPPFSFFSLCLRASTGISTAADTPPV
jgi:hypothetical protein